MKNLAQFLLVALLVVLIPVTPAVAAQPENDPFLQAPVAVGTTGTVGNFEIDVIDTTPDATDIVLDFDVRNEAPAAGIQYFMVRIAAVYTGSGNAGSPGRALQFRAVGASGIGYFSGAATCGRLPDHKFEVPQLEPGAQGEFNICWEIDAEDAGSLVMLATAIPLEAIPAGTEERWFSLGNDFSVQQLPVPESEVTAGISQAAPVPAGKTGKAGEFLLTIGDVVQESSTVISGGASGTSLNESQFVSARITAAYAGERYASMASGYEFQLVGASGTIYAADPDICDDSAPALGSAPEVFRGGTIGFVLCWKVDAQDATSLVLSVTDTSDAAAAPVWFALSDE